MTPLAHQMRPTKLSDFIGYDNLLKKYPFLKIAPSQSIVFWGPPGRGKTTLAKLWAQSHQFEVLEFHPTQGGVAQMRKLVEESGSLFKKALFIDEIHRLNRAQQDSLLPYAETGDVFILGATTHKPTLSLIPALLSRLQIVTMPDLDDNQLSSLLVAIQTKLQLSIPEEVTLQICSYAKGDVRKAINLLELAKDFKGKWDHFFDSVADNRRQYDYQGDRHYDTISAFIKSMRGSDPQSALYWLAVMIDGGEDPLFIARRIIIFASEDIGNADPRALTVAVDALRAIEKIGMPEGRIILAQATTYCASTVKSNASYLGIEKALEYVRQNGQPTIPIHLQNLVPNNGYLYPHDFPNSFVVQKYTEENLPAFYEPLETGSEKFLKKRLHDLWSESQKSTPS